MNRKQLMNKFKHIINNTLIDFYKDKIILGRKNKFNNFFYIKYIFRVFFFGDLWETFNCPSYVDRTTFRKKFCLWRDLGIFTTAFNEMRSLYCNKKKFKNMFIDSACIQNMNCSSNNVAYYHKIKSKKQIKLSIITTENNIPLCHVISNPVIHDSKFIEPLVSQLRTNKIIKLQNNAKIVGDKGYITKKKKYNVKNKKVTIVTPKRKNQLSRNNKKNKILLKKRYVVEQTFSHLRRTYRRLQLIYDRNIKNYETFLIMAFTCQIIRKL
jgi:hypothetical protein